MNSLDILSHHVTRGAASKAAAIYLSCQVLATAITTTVSITATSVAVTSAAIICHWSCVSGNRRHGAGCQHRGILCAA
ncbi:hypothetical protein J6590_051142 [Homalodisca vitripennis]|nr:hypothetical protein J6590_051142 [Homalodisca vitripennis]